MKVFSIMLISLSYHNSSHINNLIIRKYHNNHIKTYSHCEFFYDDAWITSKTTTIWFNCTTGHYVSPSPIERDFLVIYHFQALNDLIFERPILPFELIFFMLNAPMHWIQRDSSIPYIIQFAVFCSPHCFLACLIHAIWLLCNCQITPSDMSCDLDFLNIWPFQFKLSGLLHSSCCLPSHLVVCPS